MLTKFRADVIYGPSKHRKTSNVGIAAMYFCNKTGKKARLVTMDGGGFEPIESLVESGMIDVWPLLDAKFPIEALDLACQGWWPDATGKLTPPTPETWKQVCFYGFEGLTSAGDMMLRHLAANQTRLSQDPSYTYSDGGHKYSGTNMSYFGEVQSRLYDFVLKTQMLPVERVLWTALEGKGDEEGTKVPVYGPSIAGKKAIGKAPQWFGNCLHLEALTSDKEVTIEVGGKQVKQLQTETRIVMYLQPHADPLTRVSFPAGTRAPFQFASELPAFMEPDMGKLYAKLDELKQRATQSLSTTAVSK